MPAARSDLYVEANSAFSVIYEWQSTPGVDVDLTGYVAFAQVRQRRQWANESDAAYVLAVPVLAEFNTTPDDGEGTIALGGAVGTITLSATAAQTEGWMWRNPAVWDLWIKPPASGPERLIYGMAVLSAAVSRGAGL